MQRRASDPKDAAAGRPNLPGAMRPTSPRRLTGALSSLLLVVLLLLGAVARPGVAGATGAAGLAAHLLPPGDAPVLRDGLKRTPVPPGFKTEAKASILFAYPPEIEARVQPLIEASGQVRAELITRLGQPVLRDVAVYVARTRAEMATLAPEGAPYPSYAGGVAYSSLGLVLLTLEPDSANARHNLGEVFRHELAHVALHDALEGRPVPRWFNEGFAVFASGESSFPRLQTLWTATLADTLIPLNQLERGFPRDATTASIAYAQAADIVRFLVRTQERHRFERLVELMRQERPFEEAVKAAYGLEVAQLEYEWRQDVARRYTFWPVFFSGGFIWVGAVALFVWGWKRRRRRDRQTLARWDQEETRRRAVVATPEAALQEPRINLVVARHAPRHRISMPTPKREVEIPKVEHEGCWHTLH